MKHARSILALLACPLLAGGALGLPQSPCGQWTVLDVPFDSGWNRAVFEDVAGLPDGSAWAVGYAQLPSPPNGPENVTLAMHYDGSQWTHTPTPYVASYPGGANDFLHAVAALAPDDVWAAGERHGDAGGLSVGAWLHVLHWDGSDWSEMPVPAPPGGAGINFSGLRVYDIAALDSDDVWFAGVWGEPNSLATVTWRPLAMHWDGSGMTVYPTPVLHSGSNSMHMRQMAAVSANDIWGICRTNTAGGVTTEPALLHFDGSAWTQVATPSLGTSVVLRDVVATAADDVWIFGDTYFPSSPFALHWDGSSFSVVTGTPFASTAAARSASEIYLGNAGIELFDGTGASVVEDMAGVSGPSVLGMDALPGQCLVWAVGRRLDGGNGDLAPLAAVMSAGGNPLGSNYCVSFSNSTGAAASLSAFGSSSVAANQLTLVARDLPANQPGLVFYGPDQVLLSFGNGIRCVAGGSTGLARLGVSQSGASGELFSVVNLNQPPTPTTQILPGSTWNFQAWFRDPLGGGSLYNLSDGLEISFTP